MTLNNQSRESLFDRWATHYDDDADEGKFPLIGYGDVLHAVIHQAALDAHHRILDLGVGTGNLSKLLPVSGDQIWGADFSEEMLQRARTVLLRSHLIQVDLRSEDWPEALNGPFDRIVSAYTFHEFTDSFKAALLLRLARESLKADGLIVVGDVSFKTTAEFDNVHQDYLGLWDEDEYYWCADRMISQLEAAGFKVDYEQVSACGGVYRLSFSGSQSLHHEPG